MKKIVVELMSKKDNKQTTNTFVVASTKSKNNLVDALKVDYFVNTLDKQDIEFYIDRDSALASASELAKTLTMLNEQEQNLVAESIVNAFEVACLVKRPEQKK